MNKDEIKLRGSCIQAPACIAQLYAKAFEDHHLRALWNRKQCGAPTIAQAMIIADALRREGNMQARQLAESIETACNAAL